MKSGKKKQKYFILTDDGKDHIRTLKRELSNLEIKVILPNDTTKLIKLKKIISNLDKEKIYANMTEIDIYNFISKDGILEIEQLKNLKKVEYIDFSSEAPRVVHFFGRKKEIATLNKWINDKKGHNIVFIHGMAGIGKTTLAAKLLESYRDSKHLFWHNFHELDTLRSVLFKMAEFLSKLGDDHLELFIRTRINLDYHEVSRILKKSIGAIDAVLIFDDFHKSNDQIRSFFVYVLRMLTSSSKTKMLILSREIVPFYDRRDVLTRKIVAELLIEGLDFESSRRLLLGKGIDKNKFKEIYGFTAGNPLFLEIFEKNGHLERYIHNELFSKLKEDERKILGIMSIYRFPATKDCLVANDDFDFEKLYNLTEKSLVKTDAHHRYFIHDIMKQFFYSRLSSSKQRNYHLIAAQCYVKKDEPANIIEAIFHYQEAGKYKKASQVAIKSTTSVLEGGYAAEFLAALERFNEKKVETKNWAEILMVKGKACSMVGECQKALLYFTQSADISTIVRDDKLKVKAICESGHILEERNELKRAMECFKEGLKLSEKAGYFQGMGDSFRGIGRLHWRNSEHNKAILSYKKCIEISEKVNEQKLLASTYIDLGNVHDERNETEKAIKCYNKSLDILEKIKDPSETARAYGNLAIMYRRIHEFDKALEYGTKFLNLAKNLQDLKLMGYGYAGISYCYTKINEWQNARDYVKKAEDIASKIDNENIMYQVNKTYAQICKHEQNWEGAVTYLKKSIEVDEKLKSLYTLSNSHNELSLLFEEMGDHNNAKKHLEIATNLNKKLSLGKPEPI
ncbi:MAG: tetratricopeptide repeat protein [Thermoplasmata archaeon]|nr:MAG: tetratricopeptide repeat protein [Thermoplasmata archaeon]